MFLDIFIKSTHSMQWDISNPTKAFHMGDISWSTIVWATLQYSLWNEIQISPPPFSHIKWCTMPGGYLWVLEATFVTFDCEPQISLLREAQRKKGLSWRLMWWCKQTCQVVIWQRITCWRLIYSDSGRIVSAAGLCVYLGKLGTVLQEIIYTFN